MDARTARQLAQRDAQQNLAGAAAARREIDTLISDLVNQEPPLNPAPLCIIYNIPLAIASVQTFERARVHDLLVAGLVEDGFDVATSEEAPPRSRLVISWA